MVAERLSFAAEGERFEIVLDRSSASRTVETLCAHLPMRADLHCAKIAGNHILWHAPFVVDAEGTTDVMTVAPGAFLYWPERQFLELVFAPLQAESAAITVLGHVEGDIGPLVRIGEAVRTGHGTRPIFADIEAPGEPAPAWPAPPPEDAWLAELRSARAAIWREEPEEIRRLVARRGVMLPAGPLLYAEAEARKVQEFLWLLRHEARRPMSDGAAFVAPAAALLLRGAETRISGLCGLTEAGRFLLDAAAALEARPDDPLPVIEEAILYAGRLAAWLDQRIPWNALNDTITRAADGYGQGA